MKKPLVKMIAISVVVVNATVILENPFSLRKENAMNAKMDVYATAAISLPRDSGCDGS